MQKQRYVKGLVSVIIPTYKRSDMLMKAIKSVLSQTYTNIELIVVNDNEVGDLYSLVLYDMIKKIDDDRLVFLEQEKHINGAAARNAGIKIAKGEYIAFQDDDDYWDKNKLERQVRLLSSLDNSYGAVACMKKIYRNGKLMSASLPFSEKNLLLHLIEGTVSLGTGSVLIRRAALDDTGYFDENLKRHQDMQLFVNLASKYKVKLDKVYMQNRETKDTQNRPAADSLKEIKEAYLHSINDIVEQYPPRIRKRIVAVHHYQIAVSYMGEKNYKSALKQLTEVAKAPVAVPIAVKMMARRVISIRFKNQLEKIYQNR